MVSGVSVSRYAGHISGFSSWNLRPMGQRQRDDMVILTYIREQPRMTEESLELGAILDLYSWRVIGRLSVVLGKSPVGQRETSVIA